MKNANRRLFSLLAATWGLSSCGINPVKSTLPLDLKRTGSIEIVIDSESPAFDTNEIKTQTGKNLTGWNYPIAPSAKDPVSHRMAIEIGNVKHSNTPTGFSFTIGNADPRALDFQKADVLPITCKLESINQTTQSAELNMGFADSAVTGAQPDLKELSDHVSTVCFNLLREINWPVKNAVTETQSSSSSWMPEIRIETEEQAPISGNTATEPTTKTQSTPKTDPARPANVPPEPGQNEAESIEEKPKAVTKEINKQGRKIYVIHNQGNPVIFNFGFERK